jgi:hypothetical protein
MPRPPAAETDVTSVREAKATAVLDEMSPEGRAYERALTPWFGPAITPVERDCLTSAPAGADVAYDLAIQLGITGTPKQALVEPSTAFTECVRAGVLRLHFPEPPKDGHWTVATMLKNHQP